MPEVEFIFGGKWRDRSFQITSVKLCIPVLDDKHCYLSHFTFTVWGTPLLVQIEPPEFLSVIAQRSFIWEPLWKNRRASNFHLRTYPEEEILSWLFVVLSDEAMSQLMLNPRAHSVLYLDTTLLSYQSNAASMAETTAWWRWPTPLPARGRRECWGPDSNLYLEIKKKHALRRMLRAALNWTGI